MSEEDRIRAQEHTEARLLRMMLSRDGQYTNCRYHTRTQTRALYCLKHQEQRMDCHGCMTCPNCSGLMFTYQVRLHRRRDHVVISHQKTCALCGAYIEEHYIRYEQNEELQTGNSCQVAGCRHKTHENHQHAEQYGGQEYKFTICLSHFRKLKTWRLHPDKGEQHKPIIMVAGALIDNPDYKLKGCRR